MAAWHTQRCAARLAEAPAGAAAVAVRLSRRYLEQHFLRLQLTTADGAQPGAAAVVADAPAVVAAADGSVAGSGLSLELLKRKRVLPVTNSSWEE